MFRVLDFAVIRACFGFRISRFGFHSGGFLRSSAKPMSKKYAKIVVSMSFVVVCTSFVDVTNPFEAVSNPNGTQ
jgi:hypothetical protein